uniref:Uncharacterized protein n=1 Tax=Phlebotomus papatasi TaxID=29031 RepID=A0A240SZ07_PHLPP
MSICIRLNSACRNLFPIPTSLFRRLIVNVLALLFHSFTGRIRDYYSSCLVSNPRPHSHRATALSTDPLRPTRRSTRNFNQILERRLHLDLLKNEHIGLNLLRTIGL